MTTTNTHKSGNDYTKVLADMVAMCGLGEESQTNARDLAASIEANESVVSRLRTFAERIGGLQVRYEGNMVSNRLRGRSAYWRFVHDAPWMIKRAKELWGFEGIDNQQIDKKMPKYSPLTKGPNGGRPPVNTMDTNHEQGASPQEETQIAQGAQKIRTKVTQPEALIEAVNQYRGREAFIEQELVRFHEMGIEIDRSAIKFETNDAYEQMVPLVEYIDRLKGAIDRQAEALYKVQKTGATSDKVETLTSELRDSNNKLTETRQNMVKVQTEHRIALQYKDREIQALRAEVQKLATANLQNIAAN